MVTYLKS
jgi:hypothetical protein